MSGIEGLVIIGYFLWWSINECRITRDDLTKLLATVGIDYKMPEMKFRSAFLKALKEVQLAHRTKGLLIRKIKKDAGEYIFGLVDEHVDKRAQDLSYSHSATLKFNPESGNIWCDNPHRAFDLIKERYFTYKDLLNSDDVRAIILSILSKYHTVSVRQRGGIYFIHEKFADLVERMEMLMAQLPGDCYLAIAPQIDAERSKRAIHKALLEGLKEKIKTFSEELEEGGLTREHALKNRLTQFKEIKAEISFYAEALEFQAGDLTTRLDDLAKKIQEKLS